MTEEAWSTYTRDARKRLVKVATRDDALTLATYQHDATHRQTGGDRQAGDASMGPAHAANAHQPVPGGLATRNPSDNLARRDDPAATREKSAQETGDCPVIT